MFIPSNTTNVAYKHLQLYTAKDILAIAQDRDSAQVVAEAIREEIQNYDHVDTGKMLDSISVSSVGGGEYAVKGIEYAKWVNGRDRENTGAGFIDDAVNSAILDNYEVEIMV